MEVFNMEEFKDVSEEKNSPEKRFSCGPITATVWKNNGKTKAGDPVDFRTVSFQLSYKDKAGEWKSSSSLRANDIPKAQLALGEAYKFLVLKDNGE